jgi:hypothetical protein
MNKLTALLFVLLSGACFGQQRDFNYKRPLPAIPHDGWYALTLPADIFRKVDPAYADLRIISLASQDTMEIPYIVTVKEDETTDVTIQLRELNKSSKDGKLYITFEVPKTLSVNYVDFSIEEENFDGSVTLEGSNDQREWFEIVQRQRILSITNDHVNFSSTALTFPESNYRFLRANIQSTKPVTVTSASFKKTTTKPGTFRTIDQQWNVSQNKAVKQTLIDIAFRDYQLVNKLIIDIPKTVDYYRAFTIEVLQDSAQTPKGWTYYYTPLYSGYLTSLSTNTIEFSTTLAKKIRVTINNADNPPLTINQLTAHGPQVEMIMKLTADENYFLLYGDENIAPPSYDLVHFQDQIPDSATNIAPGAEEFIGTPEEHVSPLLENKLWLWGAMLLVMGVLGFFTLKMMKSR